MGTKWIAIVYLKPGDLRLSQYLAHHNWLTPDIAPSFSVHRVGLMVVLFVKMLLLIKGEVYRIILLIQKL